MEQCDVLVIGGGPAGLAAAIGAREAGASRVVVLDRNPEPGGILYQCVHPGFGLQVFKEELTGPEFADRFVHRAKELGVEVRTESMVLELTPDRIAWVASSKGYYPIQGAAVVLAMGCRERARGALGIPGTRPAGIYTAGSAQKLVNMEGRLPGNEIVIVGSGDIGLIMARRLTLEGAKVKAVVEIMPYYGGLTRNIVQCLEDFDIPLYLSHSIVSIEGVERVEGVIIAQIDSGRNPIEGTEKHIECDTLLLSAGLIPENELSVQAGIALNPITNGPLVNEMMETTVPGFFAGGNVVHVHDLVDNVTVESAAAGRSAALFAAGSFRRRDRAIPVRPGAGVRYVVPSQLEGEGLGSANITLLMRVAAPMDRAKATIFDGEKELVSYRKQYLRPSEMLSIALPARSMASLGEPSSIRVEVTEEPEAEGSELHAN